MKPNADMITKILSDLRVNGKVAQDRLLIGKGSDEVLTFGSGNLKVRYTPQVDGNGPSSQKLEYTTDGSTWHSIGEAPSEATVVYEPIKFTDYNFDRTSKIHIQHNFNNKNVLCLGYTVQPKEVEYLDNELVLDYSDLSERSAKITRATDPVWGWTGFVWFINSQQSMLSGGSSGDPLTGDPVYVVSNAGTTSVNGEYRLIKPEFYNQYVDQTYIDTHTIVALYTNGTAVLETNGAEPYFYKTGFTSNDTPFYAGVVSTDPNDPLTVTAWNTLDGTAPVPTIATWSGREEGN